MGEIRVAEIRASEVLAVEDRAGEVRALLGWSRQSLVRRSLTRNGKGEHELAYYLCAAHAGTTDGDLIRVAGSRWAVECFQTAKTETGLDQYQGRRYDAWYRHITLAMLVMPT